LLEAGYNAIAGPPHQTVIAEVIRKAQFDCIGPV
jgi:hypothetical protein